MPAPQIERLLALGLQDFLATVKTARRDVVTQMRFTRGRLNSQRGCSQEIVGAMHATLGWGFFVLLNGHKLLHRSNLLCLTLESLQNGKR